MRMERKAADWSESLSLNLFMVSNNLLSSSVIGYHFDELGRRSGGKQRYVRVNSEGSHEHFMIESSSTR